MKKMMKMTSVYWRQLTGSDITCVSVKVLVVVCGVDQLLHLWHAVSQVGRQLVWQGDRQAESETGVVRSLNDIKLKRMTVNQSINRCTCLCTCLSVSPAPSTPSTAEAETLPRLLRAMQRYVPESCGSAPSICSQLESSNFRGPPLDCGDRWRQWVRCRAELLCELPAESELTWTEMWGSSPGRTTSA